MVVVKFFGYMSICLILLFFPRSSFLLRNVLVVAERALFLWNNEHIVGLIAQNRNVIFPIIFDALQKNIDNHWNQAIHGLTVNVRKMFMEMDANLFDECQRQYSEKAARATELEEQRELRWQRLAAAATQGH
ncbi:hypothetical protein KY290_005976 [Solanum tuberosum]|uniref:Uncharacterized protein n=1 Tax=Solanum tuberosum TaxID=4113 RepID=A0ABQ7WHK8_SOLTU|nr:hypothetical protein KY290_005976 [Solanum tuberosum]